MDASWHTPSSVLVIGGGYGGIAVAKGLDDVAEVTLVEPKDAFVYNVAALRALVAPEWLPKIFLPYDHLLENGRVVRDAPVTDYLAGDLAMLRTPEGYVVVTPYMELPGQEGIFAVGDIAAGHPNGAGRARRHGDLVAANIRTLITGQGELMEAQITPPAIILPLGPEGGAGQRPDQEGLLGTEAVAEIKGRDMMVDRYAQKLGVLQPATRKS